MAKAKKGKQLHFVTDDRPGLLMGISEKLAAAKVNITAICAYAINNRARFMLTADSTAKAKKVLAGLGHTVEEQDILTVEMPNKAGALNAVARKVSGAGLNISFIYATSGAAKSGTCVLSTADDKKAMRILNK